MLDSFFFRFHLQKEKFKWQIARTITNCVCNFSNSTLIVVAVVDPCWNQIDRSYWEIERKPPHINITDNHNVVNKELAILSKEIKYPIELYLYLLGCSYLMSIVKYTTIDMLFRLITIQHNWGILNNVQQSELWK